MASRIDTESFYGSDYKISKKLKTPRNNTSVMPYKINDLVNGPPITWKVFKKQAEALEFITKRKSELMAFAFESGRTRLFLVAHPEVFWHYDSQRPPDCRCSYEIIPENTVCKLYFDLEFNIPLNPTADGSKIVQNFIKLLIFFLQDKFNVACKSDHIINLDSSTSTKFSRHLIFNIPNVCFSNNNQVGNFVEFVCNEILKISETKVLPERIMDITVEDCSEMIVIDSKENKTLFCDLSVYSRNRHFRLYKSTKYGKSAPLLCSLDDKDVVSDKNLFLASLVTYIPSNFENTVVLNFEKCSTRHKLLSHKRREGEANAYVTYENDCTSMYKEIENFINELVFPGKIYRSFYFPSSKVLNYDIVGNRFCGNIGRQHKNNNVKYIVDLRDGTYYQKCHDFDCSYYKSEKKPLPKQLHLSDCRDSSIHIGVFDTKEGKSLERFPSCGLSDDDIINHLSNETIQGFPTFELTNVEVTNRLADKSLPRFPSFELSDEDIINHLSMENIDP